MTDEIKRQVLRQVQVGLSSERGRKAATTLAGLAITATGAVVRPAAAPFVVIGAAGYGLWRLLKN